jgi:biotin transport system substrate-specific component
VSISEVVGSRPLLSTLLEGRSARWPLEATAVAAGIAAVALLAKVSFFIGPVPISGQTLGVLLVGIAYGSARGATTMAGYVLVGLLGVPVFAGPTAGAAYVLTPSFGFVIGFIPCAWLAGWLAERGWDRTLWRGMAATLLASVIPFLIGVPYMMVVLGAAGDVPSFVQTMEWGVLPFIPGGIVKATIVALALRAAWALNRRINDGSDQRGRTQ